MTTRRMVKILLAWERMKKHRFLSEIVAGILAFGGLTALADREPVKASVETPVPEPEKPVQKIERGLEQDPQFQVEHPIEAELRALHVSPDVMRTAMNDAAELIRSHRYGDAKNEETYFAACRDTERWAEIQKSAEYASEKTGIPKRVLLAMGLMESQFRENASRSDTDVHGPYQMTLATAKDAAKNAGACFGFPIKVDSVEDLKETKTAVRLAALDLKSRKKEYGQLGLAIIGYAGGRVALEKKIKEAFPEVDLGAKDWSEMQRHHLAERTAQKQRDGIFMRMKGGRVSDVDRKELRKVVGLFEAAGAAYIKAKKAWKEKRDNLPKTLADAGVTAISLYEHEKAKGGEVPHSITYPLALDDLAERAERHAEAKE